MEVKKLKEDKKVGTGLERMREFRLVGAGGARQYVYMGNNMNTNSGVRTGIRDREETFSIYALWSKPEIRLDK